MDSNAALELVKLKPLMERTSGRPEIAIGLIDGPVVTAHPELAKQNIREVPGSNGVCRRAASIACQHGTFVAGILTGQRNSTGCAICPECTLLPVLLSGKESFELPGDQPV